MDEETTYKIVIVGDSGVGKSNLITLEYKGKTINSQLWDTAGQERFRAIASAYYHRSKAAIVVYDITENSTFENVPVWLHEIEKNGEKDCIVMILGNKVDLSHNRQVTKEIGEKFASEKGYLFFETSAKEKTNVKEGFEECIKKIFDTRKEEKEEPKQPEDSITLTEVPKENPKDEKKKNYEKCCKI